MKGTVVVAGRTLTVTRLALCNGQIEIIAEGAGPIPIMRDEVITIFGEDEQGFAQGGKLDSRMVLRGERLELLVALRFTRIEE